MRRERAQRSRGRAHIDVQLFEKRECRSATIVDHSSANHFLDASSHLYMRVCPSVRVSVRPSVCPSVNIKEKPPKTTISACETHRITRPGLLFIFFYLSSWTVFCLLSARPLISPISNYRKLIEKFEVLRKKIQNSSAIC